MLAALDRADGDRIGDQESLRPGLDHEQSCQAFHFAHLLTQRHANHPVPAFPD